MQIKKYKHSLTFEFHANIKTFLETAERAAFPLCFVYVAGSLCNACVNLLVLNGSFEEPLARFTGE